VSSLRVLARVAAWLSLKIAVKNSFFRHTLNFPLEADGIGATYRRPPGPTVDPRGTPHLARAPGRPDVEPDPVSPSVPGAPFTLKCPGDARPAQRTPTRPGPWRSPAAKEHRMNEPHPHLAPRHAPSPTSLPSGPVTCPDRRAGSANPRRLAGRLAVITGTCAAAIARGAAPGPRCRCSISQRRGPHSSSGPERRRVSPTRPCSGSSWQPSTARPGWSRSVGHCRGPRPRRSIPRPSTADRDADRRPRTGRPGRGRRLVTHRFPGCSLGLEHSGVQQAVPHPESANDSTSTRPDRPDRQRPRRNS